MSHYRADTTREGHFRRTIVSAFEGICLLVVLIPTVFLGLATAHAVLNGRDPTYLFLMTIGIFLVSVFISGGALTLLTIAHNTEAICRILQVTRELELHQIATDVHRIEKVGQDKQSEAADKRAVSEHREQRAEPA